MRIRPGFATRWIAPCFVAPLALASAACTGTVAASQDAVDAEASSVTAVIAVERTSGVGSAGATDGARGEAVARVLRMRAGAVDDDALRMVGAAVDFPTMGSCARAAAPTASNSRAVELLDVGAITLEADGVKTNLVARRLPDVADLVSGVVYTTRSSGGEGFPARGRYEVRVAGLDRDVAAFGVEANVVGEPAELRVAGQPAGPTGQEAAPGSPVSIAPNAPVDLAWTVGATLAFDVVYIDVAAPGGQTTRCLFSDSGRATVPASAFTADDGTLSVHRVHREAFRAPGVDTGELRFDFARVVAYRKH